MTEPAKDRIRSKSGKPKDHRIIVRIEDDPEETRERLMPGAGHAPG